ncbi:hypothetical protein ACS0TY_002488 [Phlomoides rotata]
MPGVNTGLLRAHRESGRLFVSKTLPVILIIVQHRKIVSGGYARSLVRRQGVGRSASWDHHIHV